MKKSSDYSRKVETALSRTRKCVEKIGIRAMKMPDWLIELPSEFEVHSDRATLLFNITGCKPELKRRISRYFLKLRICGGGSLLCVGRFDHFT